MIYLIIFVLLLYLSYRYDYLAETNGKKVWIIAVWVIFVLLPGLRYRVGTDTIVYMQEYARLKPINQLRAIDFETFRFAPGFIVLTSLFKYFTKDFTWFQLFHAIIVSSSVFLFFRKQTRHFFFALFLFFLLEYYLLFFEQIRESLAVAVFLFAWRYFEKGKWIRWYVACVVALMFHVSSAVMLVLPLVALPWVRELFVFGSRQWIICLAFLLVGLLIQSVFFKYIQMLEIAESVTERAAIYSKSKLGSSNFSVLNGLAYLVIYAVYPVVALYFLKKIKSIFRQPDPDKYSRWDAMSMISVYISLISLSIAILTRFNNYFFFFAIVNMSNLTFTYLPWMGKVIKLKFAYWILLFLPLMGLCFKQTYYANVNDSGTLKNYMLYYPYSSCFDETIDSKREACIKYRRR